MTWTNWYKAKKIFLIFLFLAHQNIYLNKVPGQVHDCNINISRKLWIATANFKDLTVVSFKNVKELQNFNIINFIFIRKKLTF